MHTTKSIKKISEIIVKNRIELPEDAGVYAFWWLGTRSELMNANRHLVLKGPAGRLVDVELMDWWPSKLKYPCLYVGKSTNIKKRFSLHLMRGSPGRLHTIPNSNQKKDVETTSCQLRYGIEHVFKNHRNPLKLIESNVGFSFSTDFDENAIAERFYTEDKLIGTWRPWFNVDSER